MYSKYNESEAELRARNEELMKKIQLKDLELRKKDEDMFSFSREIQSLKSDMKNM